MRHQHFWRNSDKLPPDHRLYVASADIKQALEEVRLLPPCVTPLFSGRGGKTNPSDDAQRRKTSNDSNGQGYVLLVCRQTALSATLTLIASAVPCCYNWLETVILALLCFLASVASQRPTKPALLSCAQSWSEDCREVCTTVQAEPVRGRRQITSAERTNMWSVCLTSKGVLNYLNRRISPVGEHPLPSERQQCNILRILPESTAWLQEYRQKCPKACCSAMRYWFMLLLSGCTCLRKCSARLQGTWCERSLDSAQSPRTERSVVPLRRCPALQSNHAAGQGWVSRANPYREAFASAYAGSAAKTHAQPSCCSGGSCSGRAQT